MDLGDPDRRAEPIWSTNWSFYNDSQFSNWQAYINQRLGFLEDRLQFTGGILNYDTYTYARNHLITDPPGILDDNKAMWISSVLFKAEGPMPRSTTVIRRTLHR